MALRDLEGIDLSTEEVLGVLKELAAQVPPKAVKKTKWRWIGSGDPGIEGTVDLSKIGNWDAEWTKEEFIKCCTLFHQLDGERLSEPTIEIHELALALGRRARQVEAQLLMFRPLADPEGERWSRTFKNSNTILKEVYDEYTKGLAKPAKKPKTSMNPFVKLLARHGFGGEDAVIVLGHELEHELPESDPPAGVEEALAKLEEALGANGEGPGEVVFLLGGPGNGKSHQAQGLLDKLGLSTDEPSDPSEKAPREINFPRSTGNFLVVNDATIREGEKKPGKPGELAKDIRSILAGDVKHALLCINRGILVEEVAQLDDGCEGWDEEKEILHWLQQREDDSPKTKVAGGYIQFKECLGTGGKVNLRGLFLDRLSLLEKQPMVEVDLGMEGEGGLVPADYEVAGPGNPSRLESPAAKLLSSIVAEENFEGRECSSCPVQDRCPILANAKNLRNEHLRGKVVELFRAAEVTSGQLFTYRDLWALLATMVAGPAHLLDEDQEPCARVIKTIQDLEKVSEKEKKRAYFELSCFRFYEAPFSQQSPVGEESIGSGETPVSPGVKLLRRVDPVLDATEWAKPVNDAMQAISFKKDPLDDYLREEDPVVEAVLNDAAIDAEISKELLKVIHSEKEPVTDARRRKLNQWRGHSLYRFYGMCTGNYAYRGVVEAWLWARQGVVKDEDELSGQGNLEEALRHLILPNSEDLNNRFCFLPLLEPRVSPVIGRRNSYTCCSGFRPRTLDWRFFTRGDFLLAELRPRRGGALAEFHVDFPLCKEALASIVKGGGNDSECSPGFTDEGEAVSPRLERVRASFIARGALQSEKGSMRVYLVGQRSIPLDIHRVNEP